MRRLLAVITILAAAFSAVMPTTARSAAPLGVADAVTPFPEAVDISRSNPLLARAVNSGGYAAGIAPEYVEQARNIATTGGLEMLILPQGSVRVAGSDEVVLDVAQVRERPVDARNVVVRVSAKPHLRFTRAVAPGWTCRIRDGEAECRRSRIADSAGGPNILLHVRAGERTPLRPQAITARMTWREVAPGGRRVKERDVSRVRMEVAPRLRVAATRVGTKRQPSTGVPGESVSMLVGRIRGIAGTQVQSTWRQLCLTPAEARSLPVCEGTVAPAAEFLEPVLDEESPVESTMPVSLPRVARDTPLHFQFEARDEADRVRSTVTVIATPLVVESHDPRLETLDEALAQMEAIDRDRLVGDQLGTVRARITSSTRSTRVRAGSRPTLRLSIPGRKVTTVRWTVASGPRALLRGATANGMTLRLAVPRALAGEAAVIRADATLANGDVIQASRLIEVGERSTRRVRSMRSVGLAADAAVVRARGVEWAAQAEALRLEKLADQPGGRTARASTAERRFCELWDLTSLNRLQPLPTSAGPDAGVPDIVLTDGTGVWIGPGATVTSGSCSETSAIAFTNGEIQIGEHRFVRARGSITKNGLSLEGGAYRPPDEWLELAPDLEEAILSGTTFTIPKAVPVTAKLTDTGVWRPLGGEIRIPTGLELLDLPAGWKFEPAVLRLEMDGTIGLTLRINAAGGPDNGSASIAGTLSPLGQLDIEATVSRLGVLRQADGTQVTLDGAGALSFTWKDDPDSPTEDGGLSLVVSPEIEIKASGSVRLFDDFELRSLLLRWEPGTIKAEGTARVGSEQRQNFMDLKIGGSYSGSDQWDFSLSADGAWKPGAGMTVEELRGEVQRQGQQTWVSVRGRASGWTPTPALTVESMSADITNRCPPTAKEGECDKGQVRLELDIRGKLRLGVEGTEPTTWASTARFNLTTLTFTVTGEIADGKVGPEALQLRSIRINISNEQDAGFCELKTPPVNSSEDVRFGLVATGTVLGQKVSFTGQFGGDVGMCLVGRMGSMPNDLPDADNYSGIYVGYASTDVSVPLANGPPLVLEAKKIHLGADFVLPASTKDLGVAGTSGRFEAVLATKGFKASVAVTLGQKPVLFGQTSGSHLRMDSVDFSVQWGDGFRFAATARMSHVTVASVATSTIDSETPLAAEIAIDQRGLTIGARVDVERASGGEVQNAFGVADLKIRQLSVDLTLGPSPAFSIGADATLPARWSEPIGVTAGSRIRLAASISQTNPCFDFAILRPEGEASGPQGRKMAVDFANQGLLAAHKVELTIAPTGCQVGQRKIAPGFAVAFDGQIGGASSLPVQVEASLTLPTPQQPNNFKLRTEVKVGTFGIGDAVTFEQTEILIAIDVPANAYEVRLKGGINILGNVSRVDAEFRAQGLGTIYLKADVAANIKLAGLGFDGRLFLEFDMVNYDVKQVSLRGNLNFRVLGVTLLAAEAAFEYNQGTVVEFRIAVQAGIDIGIAAASGKVEVDYRLLKEPETAKRYTHRSFKVGFGGSFRIFFVRKSFYLNIVNSKVPISEASEAVSQNAAWQATDEQAQPVKPADPDIRWPIVTGRDGSPMMYATVKSVTYRTAYTVESNGGEPVRGSASGGLDVRVCISYPTNPTACPAEHVLSGVVHFQRREIDLANGIIDFRDRAIAAACTSQSRWQCAGRPQILRGADWSAAVRLIEQARSAFRAANAGQELPPLKAWSADRVPEALGAFGGPSDRKDVRARWSFSAGVQGDIPRANGPGERFFGREYGRVTQDGALVRQAPERALPLVGDWDGDGDDDLGVWYSPLELGTEPRYDLRQPDGGEVTIRRGACQTGFCGAIEPPGTPQWNALPATERSGVRGALWPIVGDWNGSTVDGMTVDDLGRVELTDGAYAGRLKWELWPQNERAIAFQLPAGFGRQADSVVDRPITGDWNADGVTDIGVYRGPAAPGGQGQWYLWLSSTIAKAPSGGTLGAPDFTIAFGSHADFPVTGDWDNSGGDGIGVVAPLASQNLNLRRQWTLRFDADVSCGENCRSDLSPFYGRDDQYPIAGRWGP